jgi:uncharacterized protein (TIGR02145 family)
MRTKLSKIAQAAALGLALAFTLSCDAAGNPSALVGRWVGVSGEDKGAVMELLSDGTGIVTYEKAFKEAGAAITWKTESGRFYVTASGVASASAYKLQGSQLTFTEDNGKVSEYAKCHKDCKEAAREYAEAALKAKFAGVKKDSFTDSRDGKGYKTVKFDNQTWLAENLNFNADGSKCYDNQDGNCQKYGRLYNWSTAKKACPSGWHLPSGAEWQTLVDFAGGDEVAGNVLKASKGWDDNKGESGNGVDVFGFSALPGGCGRSDGGFFGVGYSGYWWSAAEYDAANAWARGMVYDRADVRRYDGGKTRLCSVRCVQD